MLWGGINWTAQTLPAGSATARIFKTSKGVIMDGTVRANIKPGIRVSIVLKKDQPTGALTEGTVKDILTNSPTHPHGIKVRLEDGQVGRVKEIHA